MRRVLVMGDIDGRAQDSDLKRGMVEVGFSDNEAVKFVIDNPILQICPTLTIVNPPTFLIYQSPIFHLSFSKCTGR